MEKLKPGDTVFDVGTGSGYTAACLGYMVKPHGKVYSMEHMKYLVDFAKENIKKNHKFLLDDGVVNIKRKWSVFCRSLKSSLNVIEKKIGTNLFCIK